MCISSPSVKSTRRSRPRSYDLRGTGPEAGCRPTRWLRPARNVVERLGVEVCVQPVVQDAEDVAGELGRDSARVVVGREDPIGRLHEVDAEEQHVARHERSGEVGEELRPGPRASGSRSCFRGTPPPRSRRRAAAAGGARSRRPRRALGARVLAADRRAAASRSVASSTSKGMNRSSVPAADIAESKRRVLSLVPEPSSISMSAPGSVRDVGGVRLEDGPLAAGQVVLGERVMASKTPIRARRSATSGAGTSARR